MLSRARFDNLELPIPERTITGDATESGLYRFAAVKLGAETIDTVNEIDKTVKSLDIAIFILFNIKSMSFFIIHQILEKYPKVFEIPFNSDNKWHMSIHKKAHDKGELTQFIKGAPERVLRLCSRIIINGEVVELTKEYKDKFQHAYEYMAGKGHRVLAFAQNLLDGEHFPSTFSFDKETKNYPTVYFDELLFLFSSFFHGWLDLIDFPIPAYAYLIFTWLSK